MRNEQDFDSIVTDLIIKNKALTAKLQSKISDALDKVDLTSIITESIEEIINTALLSDDMYEEVSKLLRTQVAKRITSLFVAIKEAPAIPPKEQGN